MKSREREAYLPGSGNTEDSSNNGSGFGGFPLLMFVPFSLFFSGSWLVRPLFLGLFVPCSCFQSLLFFVFLLSFSVFCVCFSSAFPWFSFCLRYLLCFSFFACVCPLSLGLFFFFLLSHALSFFACFSVLGSVFGLIFPSLFCIFFWVDFCLCSSSVSVFILCFFFFFLYFRVSLKSSSFSSYPKICIYSARVPSRVRNQVSIKLILFFEV